MNDIDIALQFILYAIRLQQQLIPFNCRRDKSTAADAPTNAPPANWPKAYVERPRERIYAQKVFGAEAR